MSRAAKRVDAPEALQRCEVRLRGDEPVSFERDFPQRDELENSFVLSLTALAQRSPRTIAEFASISGVCNTRAGVERIAMAFDAFLRRLEMEGEFSGPSHREEEDGELVASFEVVEDPADLSQFTMAARPTELEQLQVYEQAQEAALLKTMEDLEERREVFRREMAVEVQRLLDHLEGFAQTVEYEKKKELAKRLRALMSSLGLKVACPKEGCGEPGAIDLGKSGAGGRGQWRVMHSQASMRVSHTIGAQAPRILVDGG